MRLISLILIISPLFVSGCSTESTVPHIDAGLPIVLHLAMPSVKFPETEIKLPTKAAEKFRSIVAEMSLDGREHLATPKTPLGVFVVGDHEFRWRGSVLFYLTSSESGVEIESLQLAKMAADVYESRSETIEDLISPLEELAKPK